MKVIYEKQNNQKLVLQSGDVLETKSPVGSYFYMVVECDMKDYQLLDLETGALYEPCGKMRLDAVRDDLQLNELLQETVGANLVSYVPKTHVTMILQR